MRSNLSLYVVASSIALSSCVTNPALDYAAQGKNQMLLETTQQQGIKSTADQHQLCYALLQTKRYDPLVTCLNELERRIQAGQKRTRLFGLDDATPAVWIMRAEMELELGHPANALAEAEKAYQWIQKTRENDRWVLLSTLSVATLAAQRAKDTEKAQRYLQELELVSVAYPLYHNHATTKSLALARAYMSTRQYDKVLQALQSDSSFEWRAAVMNVFSSSQEDRWAWQRLPRLYMMMRALQETGATDEALRGYRQLLSHPVLPENFEIHWRTLSETATLTEKAGNLDEAAILYTKAIDLLELYRGNVDTEINKVGEVVDKKSVYARYIDLLNRKNEIQQATEIAERQKNFAVVKYLASIPTFNAQQEMQNVVTQQVMQAQTKAEKEALIQDNSSGVASVGERQEKLRESQKAVVNNTDRETASLFVPLKPDKEENEQTVIQKRLDRGESVLIFSGGTSTGISRLWIPGRKEPIERKFSYGQTLAWTQVLRKEFEKVQRMDSEHEINKRQSIISPLLKDLYKELIADQVEEFNIKKLTIIPHNDLHYLPFSALQNNGGEYLGEQVTIHIITNMNLMKYVEGKPQIPLSDKSLILTHDSEADKNGDTPIAEKESIAISKILPKSTLKIKKEATETFFKNNGSKESKYILLAAHGIFNKKQPLNSYISLKGDALNDGKLTVEDLYSIKLNSELLTFSACLTAQGNLSEEGDDVVGLVRGGFKAGSRYIMATLWEVDDEATSMLMATFYKDYVSSKDNAAALQKAQKLVRKKYPHPYFWAAMQIYG